MGRFAKIVKAENYQLFWTHHCNLRKVLAKCLKLTFKKFSCNKVTGESKNGIPLM